MKIREGMVLQEIVGSYVVVPTGETARDFHNLIRMNKTGRDVWNGIAEGLAVHAIAKKMVETYDGVTLETAEQTTQAVVDKLMAAKLILPD